MSLPLQVDWTLATDLLIDLFFMADIALNFNTGFICDQARLPLCCSHAPLHSSCFANHHQTLPALAVLARLPALNLMLLLEPDVCNVASEFGHGTKTGGPKLSSGMVHA